MQLYSQIRKIYYSTGSGVNELENLLINEGYDVTFLDSSPDENIEFSEQPVLLITDRDFINKYMNDLKSILEKNKIYIPLILHSSEDSNEFDFPDDLYPYLFDIIRKPYPHKKVLHSIKCAFDKIKLKTQKDLLEKDLEVRKREFQELRDIGIALASEKNLDKLLEMILQKSREITNSDAGSLYLVEKKGNESFLHFKLTQNDSLDLKFDEFVMPISHKSISGFVALEKDTLNIPDAYNISESAEYSFNKAFDEKVGYRTCSILTVPLIDHKNEIIGVLQLINKKKSFDIKLKKISDFEEKVLPYPSQDERLLLSLGSQAAVSIENNILYQNIQNLFEGFVKASVTAIESRDPTTRGHSDRVAKLTVGLADAVNRTVTGKFSKIHFNEDQIKEIRYASLLHDFGKVGVRENVLLKAKKLYPSELQMISDRFRFTKVNFERKWLNAKLDYILKHGKDEYLRNKSILDEKFGGEIEQIEEYLRIVIQANEPAVIEGDVVDSLIEISQKSYIDENGEEKRLVNDDELKALKIKKGSLTVEDRLEIESHVSHTFKFLQQVPWTKELQSIPVIAYAHHEKLNGDGYPRKILREDIPMQSKMMAVSDIFDALTAADRPYKKAMPFDRALQILGFEVKDNHVDPDILNLFIEAEIFKIVV